MKKQDQVNQLVEYLKCKLPKGVVLVKNKERYEEIKQAIQDIADAIWEYDEEAKVAVEQDELIGTCMLAEFVTDCLGITNTQLFCKGLQKATTMDVTPLVDGKIKIGFTFEDAYSPADPRKLNIVTKKD